MQLNGTESQTIEQVLFERMGESRTRSGCLTNQLQTQA